jgi:hypothetical protein
VRAVIVFEKDEPSNFGGKPAAFKLKGAAFHTDCAACSQPITMRLVWWKLRSSFDVRDFEDPFGPSEKDELEGALDGSTTIGLARGDVLCEECGFDVPHAQRLNPTSATFFGNAQFGSFQVSRVDFRTEASFDSWPTPPLQVTSATKGILNSKLDPADLASIVVMNPPYAAKQDDFLKSVAAALAATAAPVKPPPEFEDPDDDIEDACICLEASCAPKS